METKVCKSCGRELPLSEFHKKTSSRDGHQSYCKECFAKLARERLNSLRAAAAEKEVGLSAYTPRQLMNELARRGYMGKLEFVERHVIDITKLGE